MRKKATLTRAEAEKAREIIRLRGLDLAAKALGIESRTLAKAASECEVHTLTASVIRGRLQVL